MESIKRDSISPAPLSCTARPQTPRAHNAVGPYHATATPNVQSRDNNVSAPSPATSTSPLHDSYRLRALHESLAHDETARLISPSPASLDRQSAALPSDQQPPRASHPQFPAIPAFLPDNNTYNTDQHVRSLPLNGSSSAPQHRLTPSTGFSSPYQLEGSTTSSFAPSHHGPISSPFPRPSRTSNTVFRTTTDLAAHHGIPQSLPPPPRTTPRRSVHQLSIPDTSALSEPIDFSNLCSNYLSMLSASNKNAAEQPSAMMSTAAAADNVAAITGALTVEEQAQFVLEALQGDFDARFDPIRVMAHHVLSFGTARTAFSHTASPDNFSPYDPNEYLTSPHESPQDDDFLTTPALGMDLDVSPSIYSSPLFDMPGDFDSLFPEAGQDFFGFDNTKASYNAPHVSEVNHPDFDGLLAMPSPDTPALDPSHLSMSPSSNHHSSSTNKTSRPTTGRGPRRSGPTGTRKNITPEALVPIDAPIQTRKYVAPSSTSRKEVPATFARKRARSQAFGDDDELADQDVGASSSLTPNEEDAIKAKRLQNTLAARRSRKRKLEYQKELEDALETVTRERDEARGRNMVLEALLRDKGFDVPP